MNTTKPRQPKWTGADGEWAVIVGRGEPVRTTVEVGAAVADQAGRYFAEHTTEHVDPSVLGRIVGMIVADHYRPGSRGVMLDREHLLAYLAAVRPSSEQHHTPPRPDSLRELIADAIDRSTPLTLGQVDTATREVLWALRDNPDLARELADPGGPR